MQNVTLRTAGAIFSAGLLLTSCVSSKKYHRSQDEVAKLRTDSTTLAMQSASLQQNLSAEQLKYTDLQKSYEAANNTNAGLQKNVAFYNDYYHGYADKQTASTTQIKDELNTTLVSSGLTEQDIIMKDGKIYVNVGEKNLFKGNTAMLTTKGKTLVNNLGDFVKSHAAVDVSVADLEQATSGSESGEAMSSTNATVTGDEQNASTGTMAGNSTINKNTDKTYTAKVNNNTGVMPADKTAHKVAVVHRKKIQPAGNESKATTYTAKHSNKYTAERMRRSTARAIAWKRQNVVAEALLKNGIPKVKLVAQNNAVTGNTTGTSAQKGVQVVLVHDMDNFYKHMSEAPASEPVSKNP